MYDSTYFRCKPNQNVCVFELTKVMKTTVRLSPAPEEHHGNGLPLPLAPSTILNEAMMVPAIIHVRLENTHLVSVTSNLGGSKLRESSTKS